MSHFTINYLTITKKNPVTASLALLRFQNGVDHLDVTSGYRTLGLKGLKQTAILNDEKTLSGLSAVSMFYSSNAGRLSPGSLREAEGL